MGDPQTVTCNVDIPVGWAQGRTTYGGYSTSLAHRLVRQVGDDLAPADEVLLVADAVPPGVTTLQQGPSNMSSINWNFSMFTDHLETEDGWWYVSSETRHATDGFACVHGTVWNSRGEPVGSGMQSVAVFS